MPTTMHDILHPGHQEIDERFTNAPDGWVKSMAEAVAESEGLTLNEDHWEVIRVLQAVHAEDQSMPLRLLYDALEARFSSKGGRRYLFTILPGGPVVQGCRLAGLLPPVGAANASFGSVC